MTRCNASELGPVEVVQNRCDTIVSPCWSSITVIHHGNARYGLTEKVLLVFFIEELVSQSHDLMQNHESDTDEGKKADVGEIVK